MDMVADEEDDMDMDNKINADTSIDNNGFDTLCYITFCAKSDEKKWDDCLQAMIAIWSIVYCLFRGSIIIFLCFWMYVKSYTQTCLQTCVQSWIQKCL